MEWNKAQTFNYQLVRFKIKRVPFRGTEQKLHFQE